MSKRREEQRNRFWLLLAVCCVCAALGNMLPQDVAAQHAQRADERNRASNDDKPRLILQKGHTAPINSIMFSPDGSLLATGSTDKTIKLWDATTGREIRTFTGHTTSVNCVAFTPDGKTLISGSGTLSGTFSIDQSDETIKVWDVATGELLRSMTGHKTPVNSIAVSLDGQLLASAGGPGIKLWNIAAGNQLREFGNLTPRDRRRLDGNGNQTIGHTHNVHSVTFNPNGKILVSGGLDGNIFFWDLNEERPVGSIRLGNSLDSLFVSFGSDERILANATDDWVRIWDLTAKKEARSMKVNTGYMVSTFAYSPDGKALAVGSVNKIKIWDATTGQEIRTIEGEGVGVNTLAFSPDSSTLACGSENGAIYLLDYKIGKEKMVTGGATNGLTALAYNPASQMLASAVFGEEIRLWDLNTGKPVRSLVGHINNATSMAFSPNGRWLASSSYVGGPRVDISVRLWNVETGEVRSFDGETFAIKCVAFSPNGQILAHGDGKGIKLWNVVTGKLLHNLDGGYGNALKSIVFSSDGQMLAGFEESIVEYSPVKVWSVETGKLLFELTLQPKITQIDSFGTKVEFNNGPAVRCIAFSPDGKVVASGDSTGSINLWDVKAKGLPKKKLTGHRDDVTAIAYSSDGTLLASGSGDGNIKLWSTDTGSLLGDLSGHVNTVNSVIFSPDNKLLISHSSRDHTAKFWSVKEKSELCSLVNLGESDWVVVAPDGRFDTNILDNVYGLHWIMPNEPFVALPLEIFMRDYYEPRLLPKLLAGEKLKPVRDLRSLNRAQPRVSNLKVSAPDSEGRVTVTLDVASQVSARQSGRDGKRLESGVYDVRLFRDGQLVGYTTPTEAVASTFTVKAGGEEELSVWRQANAVKLENGKASLTFRNIRLPRRADLKQIEFSAYAFNADRVKSETARVTYNVPRPLPSVKGRVYVIAFGANVYDDPTIKPLRFAAADVELMRQRLVAELKSRGEYAEVVDVKLTSDYQIRLGGHLIPSHEATKADLANGERVATDKSATKRNIKTVFDLLAGHPVAAADVARIPNGERLRPARPEDLIVIVFSGHGHATQEGVFYLLPADIAQRNSLQQAISSSELSLWLRDVDAGDMTLIVDACHSAASVGNEFKPGPMGSRGLGQLAYDKGMRILAATQADNVAWESGKARQGLLTFALVRDGLEQGSADFKPQDRVIKLNEWLEYGVMRVPKLYDCVRNPNCGLRDLEQVAGPAPKSQHPALFDFARKRREVVLR